MAKILGYALVLVLLLAAGLITFTVGWRPIIGPKVRATTDRTFTPTPTRLERGRYLVNDVMGCFECHSQVELKDGINVPVGKPGAGRVFVNEGKMRVVAPNITPDKTNGLGNWTDDQIARAIREGVDKGGHTLFPIMPYLQYRYVSDEDVAAVVVYLRSIEAATSSLPPTSVPFPVSRLINAAPQPVTTVADPDPSNRVARGEYLVHAGACPECHNPADSHGRPVAVMDLAGGTTIEKVASTNITPDASGISYYDENLFIQAIRTGKVKARTLHVMPWWLYRGMTDDDLKAVFAYLRTVKPVKHRVDNAEPVTECKVCRLKHGGGALN
jgi:mono/diheme cytochrome c family protein